MIRTQLVCLALQLGIVGGRTAAAVTFGPLEDLCDLVGPSATAIVKGTIHGFSHFDRISIELPNASSVANLRGVAYQTWTTPDLTGDVVITTIYGLDANPGDAALRIAGFNPLAPEVAAMFDEVQIGISGTDYHASFSATPTLAELPTLFPGFDLSPFEGGSASFFYTFQTSLPGADYVPEPLAYMLLGMGAVLATGSRLYMRPIKKAPGQ